MPHSSPTFDTICRSVLKKINPATVLDVGCGSGKYGRLARSILPHSSITGYEIEGSYIEKFSLRAVYNQIHNLDAEKMFSKEVRNHYDVCFLGDSLEHMRKSLGHDLIHFLLYRVRFVVCVVPLEYLQDDFNGIHSEAHVSSWHPIEFQLFTDSFHISTTESWFGILRGFNCEVVAFWNFSKALHKTNNCIKNLPRLNL